MSPVSGRPGPAAIRALFQEAVPGSDSVKCLLCPHGCVVASGNAGRCHVRENREGMLVASAWGVVSSLALDPVEKKPLANFFPGKRILSIGSYGCNLSCAFCQNHEISQRGVATQCGVATQRGATANTSDESLVSSAELIERALDLVPSGNVGIAYTYNEPFVNFEFVLETCRAARDAGLKNVLVTNGYVNPEPLGALMPYVDAINVDLKAFNDGFYRKICGGSLEPVKQTIATIAREYHGCDLEVTTLVIPGLNSDAAEIDGIARFLASLSPAVTLHLSRHHPAYRMPSPGPIGLDALLSLAEVARKSLASVQCGNIG